MKSDIEIAQSAPLRGIAGIAALLNISEAELEYYVRYKAKLPLSLIDREKMKSA